MQDFGLEKPSKKKTTERQSFHLRRFFFTSLPFNQKPLEGKMRVLFFLVLSLFSVSAYATDYNETTGYELKQAVVVSAMKFEVDPTVAKTRIISGKMARELIESAIGSPWTGTDGPFLFDMVTANRSKHLQIVLPNGREIVIVATHDGVVPAEGLGKLFIFDVSTHADECPRGRWGEVNTPKTVCICMPSCDVGACVGCAREPYDSIDALDAVLLQDLDYGLVSFF